MTVWDAPQPWWLFASCWLESDCNHGTAQLPLAEAHATGNALALVRSVERSRAEHVSPVVAAACAAEVQLAHLDAWQGQLADERWREPHAQAAHFHMQASTGLGQHESKHHQACWLPARTAIQVSS